MGLGVSEELKVDVGGPGSNSEAPRLPPGQYILIIPESNLCYPIKETLFGLGCMSKLAYKAE